MRLVRRVLAGLGAFALVAAGSGARAGVFLSSIAPTTGGPIYEGDLVTFRLTAASDRGDFTGGSGTVWADATGGGETHPFPSVASVTVDGATNIGTVTFRYRDQGSAFVSFTGSGTETWTAIRRYWKSSGTGGYWVYYQEIKTGGNSFGGGAAFEVLNAAPVVTSLTDDLEIDAGESFAFSATAHDPGAFDVLTFDWDLDGDGLYDDFAGRSGVWSFSAAGLFTVRLRVADGDGGFAFDSFDVLSHGPPL
ncbi:MAG TPA: PKD domain-containing protein, partial [Planctomycetaceae bacterium]